MFLEFKGAFGSPEYQLDRQAAELKKSGDVSGAVLVLQRRKAIFGVEWSDTRLAKYLQAAGRFDESMAEIEWLLKNSQSRAARLFGHQPVIVRQGQHATHCGLVLKASALICEREGRLDLAAQHQERSERYMQIAKGLQPLGRQQKAEQRG